MEYHFLGPIEVFHEGEQVPLGGRQRKTLLAVLAANANSVVTADSLVDALWTDEAPPAARRSMQAHVAHLKRALNVDEEELVSVDSGYRLDISRRSDVARFEDAIEQARSLTATDPVAALATYEEALSLWRGEPYGDLGDGIELLSQESQRLAGLRQVAFEERYELALDVRDPASLVPDLKQLCDRYPLNERLAGLYMLALYRSGRQADSLRAFDEMRRRLGTELGIDPSPELDALAQRIREQDEGLSRPPPVRSRPARRRRSVWVAAGIGALLAPVVAIGVWSLLRDPGEATQQPPVAAGDAGTLIAGVTYNDLIGGGWPPNRDLEITVDGGEPIAVTTAFSGEWRLPLAAFGVVLAPGMDIEVTMGGRLMRLMTTASLRFDRVDLDANTIEGTTDAPDGTVLTMWVNEAGRTLEYETRASDGRWAIEPADPVGGAFDIIVAIRGVDGQTDYSYPGP